MKHGIAVDDVLELAFLTISHVSKSHDAQWGVHICRWCEGKASSQLASYHHKKTCPHHIAVSLLVKAIEAQRQGPALDRVRSFASSWASPSRSVSRGLILSSVPTKALALPMRPPFCRYSSVSRRPRMWHRPTAL